MTGCASTGIAVRESLGYAKRDQLVDRVQDAREEQTQAKEQFASTLEEFQALTGHDGGDLDRIYKRLDRELKRSQSQADDVRGKIRDVERVSSALFKEWEAELSEFSSPQLRAASQRQLDDSRNQYEDLVRAMKRAESSMNPVLTAFNDQVLFLKHNLNASAIASLESSVLPGLEADVARLIAEMEASIAEADAFIGAMAGG
jgi:vacuolar-type H+-ATPase subunit D/Vma8